MHAFKFLSGFQVVLVALTIALQAAAVVPQVWHDFVLYAKYSAPAYGLICPQPLGKTLVRKIDNLRTGANAYIVRDDQRCEVVIAFRGTSLITDALTGVRFILVLLKSTGIVNGGLVHAGFPDNYNSVAGQILRTVKTTKLSRRQCLKGRTVMVTGHSLGGAVAAVASYRTTNPKLADKLYTYGKVLIVVGNLVFARFVEARVGKNNIFRGA
ncbi:putative feruloyl esterase A [Leucoagaricus sp. SymC.cos]|nr:putative feruloyl esterase A [Leucoagaricus sp. SymC.cos]